MMACMGLACASASSGLERPARITALLGLAGIAVGLSFLQAMGFKRESLVSRAVIVVPVVFCVAVTVVLMLDAHTRRAMVLP